MLDLLFWLVIGSVLLFLADAYWYQYKNAQSDDESAVEMETLDGPEGKN